MEEEEEAEMNTPPPYYLKSRRVGDSIEVWGTSTIFATLEEAQFALNNIRQAPKWEFAIFHRGQQLPGEEA